MTKWTQMVCLFSPKCHKTKKETIQIGRDPELHQLARKSEDSEEWGPQKA